MKNKIQILVYFILINVIMYILIGSKIKPYVLDNWNYLKKQPWFIPFTGLFKGKGNIFSNSFFYLKDFIKQFVQKAMGGFLGIFTPVLNLFSKITETINKIINTFRKKLTIIRNFLLRLIMKIFQKVENGTAAVTYLLMKLRDGVKRQGAMFQQLLNTAMHGHYFLTSLLHGPVAKLGRVAGNMAVGVVDFTLPFGLANDVIWDKDKDKPGHFRDDSRGAFCFIPSTAVKLKNGKIKTMNKLRPGDITACGSKILGMIYIHKNTVKLWKYNQVLLTGSHLVYEDGLWKRVNKSKQGIDLGKVNTSLVCPITSTRRIRINDTLFTDYEEIDFSETIDIIYSKNLFKELNGSDDEYIIKENGGFIELNFQEMSDIHKNNDIIGFIECIHETPIKVIDNKYLEDTIIYNKNWRPIQGNSEMMENIRSYHFITANGLIMFNGSVFRDFLGTHSPKFHSKMNTIVEEELNILL
jgi:hypothetical protein